MEIEYIETDKIVHIAQTRLKNTLNKYKDNDILLMLSGGSALSIIDVLPKDVLWNKVTITTLDERYTHNDKESNFAQIINKDSVSFIKSTAHFIDPRPHVNESLEETTKRFDSELHKWSESHPNGKIIATAGMGEDGHIAGILPFPENTKLFQKLFNKKNTWVQGYEVDKTKNPYTKRITITIPFLKEKITEVIAYVTGEPKKEQLIKLLSTNVNIAETPVYILNNVKTVTILTDIKI